MSLEIVEFVEHGSIRDGKNLSRNAHPSFLHPANERDARVVHSERTFACVGTAKALRSIEQAVVAVAGHESPVGKYEQRRRIRDCRV